MNWEAELEGMWQLVEVTKALLRSKHPEAFSGGLILCSIPLLVLGLLVLCVLSAWEDRRNRKR